MPEDVTPHQLYKQVEGSDVDTTFEGTNLDAMTTTNGWEGIVLGIASGAVVKRSYIDLSGWSIDDLTTFTKGVDVQKMRIPLGIGGVFPVIWEYDYITTRRIRTEELSFFPLVPGFLGAPAKLDLMEVVYGQSRNYAENATIPGTYVTTDTATFGSGNPVATDKLHWTRFIVFMAGAAGRLSIYPSNLVIQAVTAKEKDLVWMERLRRSYVLEDQADV